MEKLRPGPGTCHAESSRSHHLAAPPPPDPGASQQASAPGGSPRDPPILPFPNAHQNADRPPDLYTNVEGSDALTACQEVAPDSCANPAPSPTDARGWTLAALVEEFLAWTGRHKAAKTRESYGYYLDDCLAAVIEVGGHKIALASLRVCDLRPFHVSRWVDSHPDAAWGQATRRGAITAIKRVYSWAVEEGLLGASPIERVKRPRQTRRERILTPAERDVVLAACTDDAFRQFVFALGETGARPGEVAGVRADQFDPDSRCWVLQEHKTRGKTGQQKWVWLTETMVELCRQLAAQHPEGPLFRNSQGQPWTDNAWRCRFRRLRERVKLQGVVAYTCRHTFVTEALAKGVDIETLRQVLGHVDTRMITQYYSHLDQQHDHLRAAVEQARANKIEQQ